MAQVTDKTATDKQIVIDITSDFACPWCYVGYMRFNNALRAVEAKQKIDVLSKFTINWHPYMIDLQTEKNGEAFLEYNQRRWGSDSWFTKGCKVEAQKDGAHFKGFGRSNPDSYWASTLNDHRFMWFFSESHQINEDMTGRDLLKSSFNLTPHTLKAIVLKYYYERGVNISLNRNLIKLAKELKMDNLEKTEKIDFVKFLEDEDNGRKEVLNEDKKAKKMGINGVPYFVITRIEDGGKNVLWKGSGARTVSGGARS